MINPNFIFDQQATPQIEFAEMGDQYKLTKDISIHIGITGHQIKTEYIELDPNGLLTLKMGFIWDGATGVFDTKLMLASAVHDALYRLMRRQLLSIDYRKQADKIFREISKVKNSWVKSLILYWGVRWFGGRHAEPQA